MTEQLRTALPQFAELIDFSRIDKSFLYELAVHRDPFIHEPCFPAPKLDADGASLGIHRLKSYREDWGFVENVSKLHALGVPILLVHIPHPTELATHQEYVFSPPWTLDLLRDLSESLRTPPVGLRSYLSEVEANSQRYVISEDLHPNARQLPLIGKAIAQALGPSILGDFAKKQQFPESDNLQ